MHVLIAPDKFAGTMTAATAAAAIAAGWQQTAPDDQITCLPMSDGGAGFVSVVAANLGVRPQTSFIGNSPVEWVLHQDTAYLESALVIGGKQADPEAATSYQLGALLLEVLRKSPQRIVVGVGGTTTTDAGAGLLAALGAVSSTPENLTSGAIGLAGVSDIDLAAAQAKFSGVELVVATDVTAQLTGLFGAAKQFGPQKGIREERLAIVDSYLVNFAGLTDRKLAASPGAGAGGGVGFALFLLGGEQVSGLDLVAEMSQLNAQLKHADLVITGEGAFDFSSRAGKVPYGVATSAAAAAVPCILLAGQVLVGSREMRALGIESAYSMSELIDAEKALSDPETTLTQLASRVARSWSL